MVANWVWSGATHVPTTSDPAAWLGQRMAMRVPKAALVVHPHQTRPVHLMPAATCVLDLIQLRHPSAAVRAVMGVRLEYAIRTARVLFTIAPSVRDEMTARFGVDPASVTVLRLPVDAAAAARVAARRAAGTSTERYLLSVGRFAHHKNQRRLVQAFARTGFAASGGRLHLVGGSLDQLNTGDEPSPPGLRVLGVLDAAGLEDEMAGALALVHPSLAEGYGLPVAEALLARVPVTSSPIPALVEFGPPGVPMFDPTSVAAIAEAIDRTVELVDDGRYWDCVDFDAWVASQPTPRTLAEQLLDGLEGV